MLQYCPKMHHSYNVSLYIHDLGPFWNLNLFLYWLAESYSPDAPSFAPVPPVTPVPLPLWWSDVRFLLLAVSSGLFQLLNL